MNRRNVAIALQFILGLFGFYGIGRFIVHDWQRGLGELAFGIGVILILWPMILGGVHPILQPAVQILFTIIFAWSLHRDLINRNQ